MLNLKRASMTPKDKPRERPPRLADDREQSKLFIKKAREIEADEESSAADEVLGRLAKKPPRRRRKKSSD